MKNRKCLTFTIFLILFVLIFIPTVNAGIEQKTQTEHVIENSDDYGTIHGYVGVRCFPPPTPIVGAKLVLQGDFTTRITWSGLFGEYKFKFVEVDRQYTLTVTHPYYKTQSKTFTLLADEPDLHINFYMSEKDDSRSKTIIEKTECLGSIYGNAGTSLGWGFTPVFFVKVNVGCRTTYSSPILGYYKICGLPLGTYTITGSKRGYDTFTDTVTLTENDPNEQVFINLEPNGDSVEKTTLGRLTSNCPVPLTFLYSVCRAMFFH